MKATNVDLEDPAAVNETEVEDDGNNYDKVDAFDSNKDEVEASDRAENIVVNSGSDIGASDSDYHEVISSALSKENNPKIRFKCTKCDKTFSRYGIAKNHCKEDVESWRCEKCGKIIKHTNNKSRHRTRCMKKAQLIRNNNAETSGTVPGSSSNPVIKCNFCDKVVGTPASLRAHISRYHREDRLGDYNCQKCNFVSKTESELKKHDTLKHKAVKIKCPKCAYICSLASGFKKHRLAFHKAPSSSVESPVGIVGLDLPPFPSMPSNSASSQQPETVNGSNQTSELGPHSVTTVGSSETPYIHDVVVTEYDLVAGLHGGGANQTPALQNMEVSPCCQTPGLYTGDTNDISYENYGTFVAN